MKKAFTTFEAFWPFYLGEHSLPVTRWMHFVGTTIALANFTYPAWSFISDWRMWALMATGRLGAELKKYQIEPKTRAAAQAEVR